MQRLRLQPLGAYYVLTSVNWYKLNCYKHNWYKLI